jgi:hypothetical protein
MGEAGVRGGRTTLAEAGRGPESRMSFGEHFISPCPTRPGWGGVLEGQTRTRGGRYHTCMSVRHDDGRRCNVCNRRIVTSSTLPITL